MWFGALAFSVAGIMTGGAFLASWVAENGWPVLRAPVAGDAPVRPPEPAGPVFCESSGRWRDPVSRRFVRAPV